MGNISLQLPVYPSTINLTSSYMVGRLISIRSQSSLLMTMYRKIIRQKSKITSRLVPSTVLTSVLTIPPRGYDVIDLDTGKMIMLQAESFHYDAYGN